MTVSSQGKTLQCAASCGAVFQQNEYVRPSRHATGGHLHLQVTPYRGLTGPYRAAAGTVPTQAGPLPGHPNSSGTVTVVVPEYP